MRWSIETFFKFTKSYLKLGTEFQGRSFDVLISHTTVVFSRYLVMEWERRQENDAKSLGGLFLLFADEVRDLDFQTALQQLMVLFLQMAEAKTKQSKSSVFCQLHGWIASLPNYIKGLFKELSCEVELLSWLPSSGLKFSKENRKAVASTQNKRDKN
jgi:hypothetical protein